MTARVTVMAVALGCVLAGAASPSGADQFLLAGNSKGLWLIRLAPQGWTFDVLARPSARKWRWIGRGLSGSPAAAAAVDESLHVLLAEPKGGLVFPLSGGDGMLGLNAVDNRWPDEAVPVAACAAENFAGAEGKSVVAMVPRKGPHVDPVGAETPLARSRPAAGLLALGVFQNVKGNWRHVTDLLGVAADINSDILAAVKAGRLYVMVRSAGHSRLLSWWAGKWVDLPLSGPAASQALGMVVIGGRLLLVTAPGQDRLEIVELDDSGRAVSVQPIVRDAGAATWQPDAMPLIARLADQLALVWRDGDGVNYSTCSLSGELGPSGKIAILARAFSDGKGDKLLQYFLWSLLGVTMASTLLLRPRAPLGQFTLPETLQPAPLARRLLAGILDMVPFVMVALVVLAQHVWPKVLPPDQFAERLTEALEQVDSRTAYTIVATMVAYLGYCILMELQHGATIGKMLLGLRVVGDGGVRPHLRGVLLRNLVKVLILISWLAPLMLVVLFNRNRQRLGDMMGRTVVVDARLAAGSPPQAEQTHDDDAQET